MSWSYRVAKVTTKRGTYYDIREYYQDLPDGPAWTADSEAPLTEDVDELIWELRHMLKAAKKAKRRPELMLLMEEP